MPIYATSAALLFTEQELGGPVVENESYPTVLTTGSTIIAQGNGDRVGLVIMNIGVTDIYIGLNPNVSSTNGILLFRNGGAVTLTVRDDFTLPSRQWNSVAITAPNQIYVLELVRFTSNTLG